MNFPLNSTHKISKERRAVIDVGTNSVKILVADINDKFVIPIEERAIQTRLGDCLSNDNVLAEKAVDRTVVAIGEFLQLANNLDAKRIKIIGTSPLREIQKSNLLVKSLKEKYNVEIEIISGEKEAELSFLGVTEYSLSAKSKVLIADIGGGSSEFTFGKDGKIKFLKSYQIGVVKCMQNFNVSDPPTEDEYLKCRDSIYRFISNNIVKDLKSLTDFDKESTDFIGTGGTITILGRMILKENEFNRCKLDNLKIDHNAIKGLEQLLWKIPINDRIKIPGLPADKADVILFGILIYDTFMELSGLNTVIVSTRGLRFGAIKYF